MNQPSLFSDALQSGALLSPSGMYRYLLWRVWAEDGNLVNFVMLNPSVADAELDDPTITRCMRRAREWGHSGLLVTNLFAYRATDPRELKQAPDPVGPENDAHLLDAAAHASRIVCAWGALGKLHGRAAQVRSLLRAAGHQMTALRLSRESEPCHPLYLPYGLETMPYE